MATASPDGTRIPSPGTDKDGHVWEIRLGQGSIPPSGTPPTDGVAIWRDGELTNGVAIDIWFGAGVAYFHGRNLHWWISLGKDSQGRWAWQDNGPDDPSKVVVTPPPPPATSAAPAWLAGQSLNTWIAIPNTALTAAADLAQQIAAGLTNASGADVGFGNVRFGMMAFSGGCLKRSTSEMLFWGGGGNTSGNNDARSLNLSLDQPVFSTVVAPTSAANTTPRGDISSSALNKDGATPRAAHSYNGPQYFSDDDSLCIYGPGNVWWIDQGHFDNVFRAFLGGNPTFPKTGWDNGSAMPSLPVHRASDGPWFAQHPVTLDLWTCAQSQIWKQTRATKQWTLVYTSATLAALDIGQASVDTKRNLVLIVPRSGVYPAGNVPFTLDCASGAVQVLTYGGSFAALGQGGIPDEFGLDYDEVLDKHGMFVDDGFFYWLTVKGTVLEIERATIAGMAPDIGHSGAALGGGGPCCIHGRMRYVPKQCGFAILQAPDRNCYFIQTSPIAQATTLPPDNGVNAITGVSSTGLMTGTTTSSVTSVLLQFDGTEVQGAATVPAVDGAWSYQLPAKLLTGNHLVVALADAHVAFSNAARPGYSFTVGAAPPPVVTQPPPGNPPPPVDPGPIDYTIRPQVFIGFPSPLHGTGFCTNDGSKHTTAVAIDDLDKVAIIGGDYGDNSGEQSYRQWNWDLIWAEKLADLANPQSGWHVAYPRDGFGGTTVQPKRPDFVGFPYDKKRGLSYFVPGTMVPSTQGNSPGETTAFSTDANFIYGEVMIFDHSKPIEQRWSRPGVPRNPDVSGDESWLSWVDPVNDCILQIAATGGDGVTLSMLPLPVGSGPWRRLSAIYPHENPDGLTPTFSKDGSAIDFQGRWGYSIDGLHGRLYRWSLDSPWNFQDLGLVPGGPHPEENFTFPTFDTKNRILLYPRANYQGFSMEVYAYHVDTAVWETLPNVTNRPEQPIAYCTHTVCYSEKHNLHYLAGGEVNQPDGSFNKFQWLYRYA